MQDNRKTKKLRVQIVCCASKKKTFTFASCTSLTNERRSDGDQNSTEEFKLFELHEPVRPCTVITGHRLSKKGTIGVHASSSANNRQNAQRERTALWGLPPRTTSQRKRSDAEGDENSDWRVSEHEASTTSASILGESVCNNYDVRVNIGALRERLKASGRSSFADLNIHVTDTLRFSSKTPPTITQKSDFILPPQKLKNSTCLSNPASIVMIILLLISTRCSRHHKSASCHITFSLSCTSANHRPCAVCL